MLSAQPNSYANSKKKHLDHKHPLPLEDFEEILTKHRQQGGKAQYQTSMVSFLGHVSQVLTTRGFLFMTP